MEKTVLITGTSSGIGKATVLYFADNGWNVIATMRSPNGEFSDRKNIFVTELEVTDNQSIDSAIHQGIEKFGKIDVLINNAGFGQQGLFEATSSEKIKAQFEVNVFGAMNVIRSILPHFRNRNTGTIINITSIAGRIPTPLFSIYGASKFALEGFSEALSYELESQNIKVKIVEPGFIPTPFYERASEEFAFNPTLTDYQKFNEEIQAFYASSSGTSSDAFTAEDVAQIIYAASTDNTYQLRYVAGPDAEQILKIRNNNSDQDYIESMRALFRPNSFKN